MCRAAPILTLVVLALLAGGVIASESDGTLNLTPDSSRVRIGEEFTIFINANTSEKIGALDIEVHYPKELVKVLSVSCPQRGVFIEHSEKMGTLRVSLVSLSGLGSGRILVIKYKALKSGIVQINATVTDAATPSIRKLNLTVPGAVEVLVLPEDSTSSTTSTATHTPVPTAITTSTHTSTHTTTSTTTTSTSTFSGGKNSTTSSTFTTSSPTVTPSQTSSPPMITTPTQSSEALNQKNGSQEETSISSTTETITTSSGELTTHTNEKVQYASIFLTSVPQGAEVYLGNERLGRTPFRIEVSLGRYKFRAIYNGRELSKAVNVSTSGREYIVRFEFEPTSVTTPSESGGKICGSGLAVLIAVFVGMLIRVYR